MISLMPIITLLRAAPLGKAKLQAALGAQAPWFRQVEGAGHLARIADFPQVPLPGCWVASTSDKSTPKGERRSVVAVTFDVVIGVTNHRIGSAGDADEMLLAYRQAVLAELQERDLLPGQTEPIERQGGAVIEYASGDLWWRDQYQALVEMTNYLPDPVAFDRINNPEVTTGAQR